MGNAGIVPNDPLRDQNRINALIASDGKRKLDHCDCCDLYHRYNAIILTMKKTRKEEPFIAYNDTHWYKTEGSFLSLQVIGKYPEKDVILFKFKESDNLFILFEYECHNSFSSIRALRQWLLEPEIHVTHSLCICIVEEPGNTDSIRFVSSVTVNEKIAVPQ